MSVAQNLVDAAKKRWPSVYSNLKVSLDGVPDTPDSLLAIRNMLLDYANKICSSCTECELNVNRYGQAVWADGDASASILILGEGPGQFEQRTLLPFTSDSELRSSRCIITCPNFRKCFPDSVLSSGMQLPDRGCDIPSDKSGRLIHSGEALDRIKGNLQPPKINTVSGYLDKALMKANLWRSSWNKVLSLQGKAIKPSSLYITNPVKCRHCVNGKDETPSLAHCSACRQFLDIQMNIIQPKIIITMGNVAASSLLGDKNFQIGKHNGEIVSLPREKGAFLGIPASVLYLIHLYHPSYISRQYNYEPEKADTLQKVMTDTFIQARELSEKLKKK